MIITILAAALCLVTLTATLTLLAHPEHRRANKHFMAGYRAGFHQATKIKGPQ